MGDEITKEWLETSTDKALAAARHLYSIGVVAATDRTTVGVQGTS
jgi:hypothetical protein